MPGTYRAPNPETENPGDPKRGDEFQYDALGNRAGTSRVASRGVMNFERKNNKLNQYRGWWPYSITNYDEDLGGWGEPGEANGVMMQDGWITASFNALNQPMGMWSPVNSGTGNYMWFGYDPLGRCVKRWVSPLVNGHAPPPSANPATYFYYDGWNLVQEGSSGNVADRVYVHGGRVDEVVASWGGGEWRHYHCDARGHCIMLTDPSGTIREQYDYDAFGLPYFYNAQGVRLGASAQWGNRFLFTGREWLKYLKVYDYRARMYQPELGRFLQPDPKQFEAGDYNLYRYCHNDPVNKTDPTGLASLFTDQANGITIFDPRPEESGPLSIYASRSEILAESEPGAGDPYTSKDVYVTEGPHNGKPDSFGPNDIIQTDDTARGRWIHGGGKGLNNPRADRQGWMPTHGCTRMQNEDIKALTKKIDRFKHDHPRAKIPYDRSRGDNYREFLTSTPKARQA